MSVEIDFHLASDTPGADLVRTLLDRFGGDIIHRDSQFSVGGLLVSLLENGSFATESAPEEFGVHCTRTVTFRYLDYSRTDLEARILDMVNFLLHREPGDAVLESGVAYLRRVGGEIVLYKPDGEQGLMDSEGQARITLPFRVEKQFTRPLRTR